MSMLIICLLCALITTELSWLISESSVFMRFRSFIGSKYKWLDNLINCPYCLSHYMTVLSCVIVINALNADYNILSYVVIYLASLGISTIFIFIISYFAMSGDM